MNIFVRYMNGKNNKPKLIMTYFSWSSFVKRDYDLLQSDFKVFTHHFNNSNKLFLPFSFVKQMIFLLTHFRKYNIIISQSSGYISFIPSLFKLFFGKKLIIIAIGTDCVKFPEFNYGAFNKRILGWFTAFSFRNASVIAPVHKSLAYQNYTYTTIKFPQQGFQSFVKKLKTPFVEIHNSFDTEFWKITNPNRTPYTFLTVTTAQNKTGYYLKGLDLVIYLANRFSDYHFTVVGKIYSEILLPKNLTVINNVPHKELLQIYNQHTHYLQLSMSEGFPNALCEAMLCGCIPIGSNVASIPEIIGDKGFVLEHKNYNELDDIMNKLNNNDISMYEVRNHIIENYSLEKRKKSLVQLIKNL